MTYLVDSDQIIDGLKGIPTALTRLTALGPSGLAVSVMTFAEVVEGAHRDPDPPARIADVRRFLQSYRLLPVTEAIAELFAERRADLRARGLLIPDLDLIIAATALAHNLTLVTGNRRHFARIPGLAIHVDSGQT